MVIPSSLRRSGRLTSRQYGAYLVCRQRGTGHGRAAPAYRPSNGPDQAPSPIKIILLPVSAVPTHLVLHRFASGAGVLHVPGPARGEMPAAREPEIGGQQPWPATPTRTPTRSSPRPDPGRSAARRDQGRRRTPPRRRAARGRRAHQAEGQHRHPPGPGAPAARRADARHGRGTAEAGHRRRGGAVGRAVERDLRSARAHHGDAVVTGTPDSTN